MNRDYESIKKRDEIFCPSCGKVIKQEAFVCVHCGALNKLNSEAAQFYSSYKNNFTGNKDKITATLLALVLGGCGAHKFYLGDKKMGVVYIMLMPTFIPALLGLIEGIRFLCMSDTEFNGVYNNKNNSAVSAFRLSEKLCGSGVTCGHDNELDVKNICDQADMLAMASNYHWAIELYDKAIAIDLQDSELYYKRAIAYEAIGDIQRAATDFLKAASLGHKNAKKIFQQKRSCRA